jgi:LysR family transcriptional regulator, regulator for bpeEF and oprC
MDRFTALSVFVRVVETGSFRRAAEAMSLPRTSVSEHVARLERHLGVRLLARTTRRLRLTEDGAVVYERTLKLLNDMDDMESSLRAGGSPKGRLRIDVPAAFGVHVLVPALAEFRDLYPQIQVEVGSSDRPVDLLSEGVDCVIRGGEIHDESLIGRELERLRVVTLASPSYLRRRGTPEHPNELRSHALVGYFSSKTGRAFPYDFSREGERIEIDGPFHVCFNDTNTFLAAGVAGLGILQSPLGSYVRTLLATKKLKRVLPSWGVDSLTHTILYPSRRYKSTRVRVFIEWALKRLASQPL